MDFPKLHLLRRATDLIEKGRQAGADDDLLSEVEMAAWWGMSRAWFQAARIRGIGPPFIRPTPGRVRYPRGLAIKFLEARLYQATSEYPERRQAKNPPEAATDAQPESRARVRLGGE
jgi:hypothetical protein